ncbi:MAG: PLP-dependent aminotransferase family protein [Clostridia bacterium]|nr:PLP-dependent aminotransferase family protein [Clostridia bacterium]
MTFVLDKKQGVQKQIMAYFREKILTGALEQGERLPTVRTLAGHLSVSPLTVTRAYKKLEVEGLIKTVQGSGTFVKSRGESEQISHDDGLENFDWMLSVGDNLRRTQFASEFSVESLSKGYNMFTSLFRGEDYPYERISELLQKVVREDHELLFRYSPVNGDHLTRKTIASYLREKGLIKVKAGDIIVTSGSQQALNIIARTFVSANDVVLMETPTFPGAIDSFQNQGCDIRSIPLEKEGMNIEILEGMVKKLKPKLIYLTPNLNNPTGILTSIEKRRMILDIARKNNTIIIEDDPWCELVSQSGAPALLKALDTDGHVIFVKGFSKLIGPGFRVGAIYAQGTILNRLTTAKANADLGSPLLTQRLLAEVISSGLLRETAAKLQKVSQERLDIAERALRKHAPEYLKWIRPDGGMNLWFILPRHLNADVFLKTYCHPNNLSFLSGRLCYPNEPEYNTCRVSDSALKTSEVESAIRLFCDLLRSYCKDDEGDQKK